jgi:hypothetical protein
MNDISRVHPALVALAAICSEAAQRHGDDWHAVERHVRRCVRSLPKDQRESLASEMDRVLRYCAPDGGRQTQ